MTDGQGNLIKKKFKWSHLFYKDLIPTNHCAVKIRHFFSNFTRTKALVLTSV